MKRRRAGSREIALLLAVLDEAYDAKAWHGPNLRSSVRRLTPAEAAWRPAPRRHNTWELVVHAAYWKYAVRWRLTGGKRGGFELEGSNWFRRPEPRRAWRSDLDLLDREHELLRETVEQMPASRLAAGIPGKTDTAARLIYGIAAHDTYHAGQIRLLSILGTSRGA